MQLQIWKIAMSESIVEDLDDLIAGLGSEVIQDVGPGGEACNLNIATQEMYGYSIDASISPSKEPAVM